MCPVTSTNDTSETFGHPSTAVPNTQILPRKGLLTKKKKKRGYNLRNLQPQPLFLRFVINSKPFRSSNFAFNTNPLQAEWVPCQGEAPFAEQSRAHRSVHTTNPSSCSGGLCTGPQGGWRECGSSAVACLFQSLVVCLVAALWSSVVLSYKKFPKK